MSEESVLQTPDPDLMQKLDHLYGETLVIHVGERKPEEGVWLDDLVKILEVLGYLSVKVLLITGGLRTYRELSAAFSGREAASTVKDLPTRLRVLAALEANHELVSALNHRGLRAVSVSGPDANFLTLSTSGSSGEHEVTIDSLNPSFLHFLGTGMYLPVTVPFGYDSQGKLHFLQPQRMAASVARHVNAAELLFVEPQPRSFFAEGVYLSIDQAVARLDDGLRSEVSPYLEAAQHALQAGGRRVHFVPVSDRGQLIEHLSRVRRHGLTVGPSAESR